MPGTCDPTKLDELRGYDSDAHTLRDWPVATESQ